MSIGHARRVKFLPERPDHGRRTDPKRPLHSRQTGNDGGPHLREERPSSFAISQLKLAILELRLRFPLPRLGDPGRRSAAGQSRSPAFSADRVRAGEISVGHEPVLRDRHPAGRIQARTFPRGIGERDRLGMIVLLLEQSTISTGAGLLTDRRQEHGRGRHRRPARCQFGRAPSNRRCQRRKR